MELSEIEKDHISWGMKVNVRRDGRSNSTYRHWRQQRGNIPQAYGSSLLFMHPHIQIIVAIKVSTYTYTICIYIYIYM